MAELAPGPAAGYIYQFELALAMLSGLEKVSDVISIEKVDDVAIENNDDLVILTVQSKHTICPNGTTFEDTSKALWRTLEIWIKKLLANELTPNTRFVCATNKAIPNQALIRKIKDLPVNECKKKILELLDNQKNKLSGLRTKGKKKGASIMETIKWIGFVIEKWTYFAIIKEKLEIWDAYSAKEKFLNEVHMNSDEYTQLSRDNCYHTLLGWLVEGAKARWLNGKTASFTKSNFESKWYHVSNSPSLIKAVFRKKEDLGKIDNVLIEARRSELFVKQIEDIERRADAKLRKIENAIIDFICCDIEMAHILVKNGAITKADFEVFKRTCFEKWEICYDSHIVNEPATYNTIQKNDLAVKIFDQIMEEIEVRFTDDIPFNTSNRYIRNGTFLQLSNAPLIGWHPDWQTKYKS